MKKVIIMTMLVLGFIMTANAQNDTVFYVNNMETIVDVCTNKYDTVLIYAAEDCTEFIWLIEGEEFSDNPVIITPEMCLLGTTSCHIEYAGCDHSYSRVVHFIEPNVPNETTEKIWIHGGELAELKAVEDDSASMYNITWSSGEEENIIYKPAGTYIAGISDMCATAYRTKIVNENVEIDLATCDLESNLNLITWQTNPAQALYIDHVIVKRDGLQVGTAPYSDGQFTDNIGSGSASRTYTLTAVATDGTECPIVSYPKETIHMAYLTGINNTIEVNWNVPAGYDLLGYNICEWYPGAKDGDLTVIDFVGASVTSYTCSENQFNEGHVVVQGVENGKSESRLLSNRSEEGIVGIGEHQNKTFKLYPNPSNGEFTVEGTTDVTVFNTLGQVITTSHSESGTHTLTLRSGVYFIKSDEGSVQKVVVE
ncbi:MAG: T9SS type A sorting domain-containing protein [Bacteroidales bacterium]|nr:T9SS type A sorting domain-containing protein [Bacteroidales bacterium]